MNLKETQSLMALQLSDYFIFSRPVRKNKLTIFMAVTSTRNA